MSSEELIWYYADQQALSERTPLGPASLRDLDVLSRTGAINSATFVWKEGMSEWAPLYKVPELKQEILDSQEEMKRIQELYEKQEVEQQQEAAAKLNKKKGKFQDKLDQKNSKINDLLKEAEYNLQMNNQIDLDKVFKSKQTEQENEEGSNKDNENIKSEVENEKQDADLDEDEQDEKEYLRLLQENPEEAIQQMATNTVNGFFLFSEEEGKWHVSKENPETREREWIIVDEEPKAEMEAMKNQLIEKLRVQFSAENIADKSTLENGVKEQIKTEADQKKNESSSGMSAEQIKKIKKNKKKTKKAAEKRKQKWYQAKINTYVYFSGLPKTTTIEEIDEFFSKAGVIRKDHVSGEKKIKLYKDDNGDFKGDGVISYAKGESIGIAISMLDGREISPGHIIKIEQANFQQSGETYKKREIEKALAEKATDKVQLLKQKAEERNQLGWEDEDQIDLGLKIVILKNVFDLASAAEDEGFLEELKKDIAIEIEKQVGPIQRLKIFEENPEGVLEIKFKNSQDAQYCIEIMNGRSFDGRKLECFFWDGQIDFKYGPKKILDDLEQDEESRLKEFGNWIEGHEQLQEDGNQ